MARRVVLVTGAGGFIGRWSVPRLLADGYEVHAVAARVPGREPPAQLSGAAIHHVDLLREDAADALMRDVRPSHLLHFAWIATPGEYWTSPDNRLWLDASRRLLQSFAGTGGVRAVMAGSCAEYDWSRSGVCTERGTALADEAGVAPTPYAECKIEMQRALAAFGRDRGVATAWGRIFFQFGPDEHPDRLVASVIRNLLAGREAPCTHGRQIRSFLHVADVGAAFAALLDSETEGPVNVGSPARISVAGLLQEIAAQIGRPELLRLGARAAPPSEPPLLVPDVVRLYGEVGWRPQFDLPHAVADTIAWWRETLGESRGGVGAAVPG
jgi:nucleoside-diphosphate-sugar epimerase